MHRYEDQYGNQGRENQGNWGYGQARPYNYPSGPGNLNEDRNSQSGFGYGQGPFGSAAFGQQYASEQHGRSGPPQYSGSHREWDQQGAGGGPQQGHNQGWSQQSGIPRAAHSGYEQSSYGQGRQGQQYPQRNQHQPQFQDYEGGYQNQRGSSGGSQYEQGNQYERDSYRENRGDYSAGQFGQGRDPYRPGQGQGQGSQYGSQYSSRSGAQGGSWGEGEWGPNVGGSQTRSMGDYEMKRGRGPKNYKRSDERIKEEINDQLTMAHDLDPSDVEVKVDGGEVTLTGTVSERRDKQIAERIAESVLGVDEVMNQLRVKRESKTSSGRSGSDRDDSSDTSSSSSSNSNRSRTMAGSSR